MQKLGFLIRIVIFIVLTSPIILHYTKHMFEDWFLQNEYIAIPLRVEQFMLDYTFGLLSTIIIMIILMFYGKMIRFGGNL